MPELTVTEATVSRRPVIKRLMIPYLRELSAYIPAETSASDDYPYLDTYWSEPGRTPYLLSWDGDTAGFALVNRWSPSGRCTDWSMAEFFVRPNYRRQGIGAAAFHEIARLHPGIWEVPILAANKVAFAFWRKVLYSMCGVIIEQIDGDGDRWAGPILRIST